MANANNYVQTVLGEKNANELGRILTHEHMSLSFDAFYVPPPHHLKRFFGDKIEIENLGLLRQYPYSSKYNINFEDKDTINAVFEDVKFYGEFGGGTIVENSNHGLKRDIQLMKRISKATGVNVIAGTGYYVAATQSEINLCLSKEEMYDTMLKEMTIGCEDCPDVKTGFIGEVGSTWPIEGTLSEEKLMEFADETNCYCQFDLFGTECSFYQLKPEVDMLSDAQRIDRVKLLRDDQKLHRVLLSHDIHTKHRLSKFGGHGFSHILNNVLPKMLLKGFTQDEIDTLTIKNPRTWLSS
ncbi:phosphotriesterase-related protein isoform X2 [Halictus rubicundus]|uniref:phosphotriesterase-related protein isoform X2 n=1 Tax=Halictus rubicundus TaxID=77578 RepID=UPI0040353727